MKGSNFTLEELLQFDKKDLQNYHSNFSRPVIKIQKAWQDIQRTIIKVNEIGIEYTCDLCGKRITKENKYLWSIRQDCKLTYHNIKHKEFIDNCLANGTYFYCDEDCLNCEEEEENCKKLGYIKS